jgi:hypothetical protein
MGLGLFMEESKLDAKNITLPLRCTMGISIAEGCY